MTDLERGDAPSARFDGPAQAQIATAAAAKPGALGTWLQRRADARGIGRKLILLLTFLMAVSGIATYAAITGAGPFVSVGRGWATWLLVIDLVLLMALAAIVVRRLVELWTERRRGLAGSRLHVRLVMLFGAVTIAPTILVAVFSVIFLNLSVDGWFSERVRSALDGSKAIAAAYLQEHNLAIKGDILSMAVDLDRESPRMFSDPAWFRDLVATQAALRNLSEALVLGRDGQVIARAGLTFRLEFEPIPAWALDQARRGEAAVMTNTDDDRVRALIRLEGVDGFLYVGRPVDSRVISYVQETASAVDAYEALEGERSQIQATFGLVYLALALLLLLLAASIGLAVATNLVKPISIIIAAAERIRAGDFSARVPDLPADDELGSLARAFNRMSREVDQQRHALLATNSQLDERRRFIEAVLAGVSAGVLGLDADGYLTMGNRSAGVLLRLDLAPLTGQPLAAIIPEMLPLFEMARSRADSKADGHVKINREGRAQTLLVRVTEEVLAGGQTQGYVVTFDDITELLAAQRTAAWADVARRIAHEIKNPLTPIQLSAERLKRKYLKEITSDPETFILCTDTIVRQVGDIGRMVDEFSAFARMPQPVMKPENLPQVLREVMMLQRSARPDIHFDLALPETVGPVHCDGRQIRQAVMNLVQNAIDAIDGREPAEAGGIQLPSGYISVALRQDALVTKLSVVDNGKGLPVEQRERLTEPYVTTRSKGTGLGLAIVAKIMEDHGGEIRLTDAPTLADAPPVPGARGAEVALILPRKGETLLTADDETRGGGVEGTYGA